MGCTYTKQIEVTAHRIVNVHERKGGGVELTYCCGGTAGFGSRFIDIFNPQPGDYVVVGEKIQLHVVKSDVFEDEFESDDPNSFPLLPQEVIDDEDLDEDQIDELNSLLPDGQSLETDTETIEEMLDSADDDDDDEEDDDDHVCDDECDHDEDEDEDEDEGHEEYPEEIEPGPTSLLDTPEASQAINEIHQEINDQGTGEDVG